MTSKQVNNRYRWTYMSPIIITSQKPTADTHNLRWKEHKHAIRENHQTIREETKRKTTEKNYKTTGKQQNGSKYISINNHF